MGTQHDGGEKLIKKKILTFFLHLSGRKSFEIGSTCTKSSAKELKIDAN